LTWIKGHGAVGALELVESSHLVPTGERHVDQKRLQTRAARGSATEQASDVIVARLLP